MEILFENEGLNFIGIKILKNLDPESLMNARLVAKPWKDLIDTARELSRNRLQIKLEILQRTFPQLFLDYPEWRRILVNFGTDRSEEDIKRLIQLLTDFFRDFFREYGYDYLDPILYSVYTPWSGARTQRRNILQQNYQRTSLWQVCGFKMSPILK